MTPEEKAAAKAPLLGKRSALEAKIASLKQQISKIENAEEPDTPASGVGSPGAVDYAAELRVELEAAEDELLANATVLNKYAGRRRRGGAESEASQCLRELERDLPKLIEDNYEARVSESNILQRIKDGVKDAPIAPAGPVAPPGFVPSWVNQKVEEAERQIKSGVRRGLPTRNKLIVILGGLDDMFHTWRQGGRRRTARRHRKARKTRRS